MWISKEYIQFFKELNKNNNKEWFHANKKRYEEHVKKPFDRLTSHLLSEIGADIPSNDAIFRINKDIRFSKDKSPYKTFMAAIISHGGRKNMQIPGIYIHMEPGNVMIGGGSYDPSKENLGKIRAAIVKNPIEFEKIVSAKEFVQAFGGVKGEKNKILPHPFKEHIDIHPLILNKQFYFMKTIEDEAFILRDDLDKVILQHGAIAKDFNKFLSDATEA